MDSPTVARGAIPARSIYTWLLHMSSPPTLWTLYCYLQGVNNG